MQKESINTKIQEFLIRLTELRRTRYKKNKQKRLKNTSPTIIGNNCVCGTIYRDLNLQYTSPTTDVLIHATDFFPFVENLEYYLHCPVEESSLDGVSYPVGVLRNGEQQITLRFMHEHSFKEAKEKWERRCKRVDPNNVYIVFQQNFPKQRIFLRKTNNWYRKFKQLPYSNKRMLLNAWTSFDKEIIALPKSAFFKEKHALEYPTKYSKKRLMDNFDYVSFLNKNKK